MERRERELASIELDPVVFLEAMSKPADSEPQTAKARRIMRPGCCSWLQQQRRVRSVVEPCGGRTGNSLIYEGSNFRQNSQSQ